MTPCIPATSLRPDFVALLLNNDPPSESTMLDVIEFLKVPLKELQEIKAEVQRLEELMETMKIKRQGIQKTIDEHNIILSPVRRLPPDLLHEIFFHCLPTHRNPVMKSSESPLLLTRICNPWRSVALSSLRIWSKIHIPLPGDPSFSGIITDETTLSDRRQRFAGVLRLRCDAVRRWLSRSGTCPLSLSVTYPGYYSGTQNSKDDELVHEMFDILLSYADRWSDIDLSMPEDIYNKFQGNIIPTKFSSLKSLKANLYQQYHANKNPSTPIRLLAAPNLRSITISAIQTTLQMTGGLVQPNWNHLTHITFASSTTDRYLLVLLRQCPNLVFGKFFVISSWPFEPIVDQEEVVLPRLESLVINDDSGAHETMTVVFNAIKAPALTRLAYQWTNQHTPEDNSTIPLPIPVIPLLENSTLISDLSLDGGLSPQDTEECLRHGGQVTRLVFGRPPPPSAPGHLFYPPLTDPDLIRPDVFDLRTLLINPEAMTLPMPRLEFLEAYQLSNLSDDDLLKLITSRIDASKRGEAEALKSVKISFQRRRQKDITEEVSRLAKEVGIEVKLDLSYPPEGSKFFDRLSPSFGLTSNDCMWSSDMV